VTTVASPDELVRAVSHERRLSPYRVRRQGEGWIELEAVAQRGRTPVLLVLAWPEVWRDAAALRPHLVRARSGNYGLILVGGDDELAAAGFETAPGLADVTALAAPIGMARLVLLLRTRVDAIALRMHAAALARALERCQHENGMVISIGRARGPGRGACLR
jgi:hypothetical protein